MNNSFVLSVLGVLVIGFWLNGPAVADDKPDIESELAALKTQMMEREQRMAALEAKLVKIEEKNAGDEVDLESQSATMVWIKAMWIFAGLLGSVLVFVFIRSGAQTEINKRLKSIDRKFGELGDKRRVAVPPYIEKIEPDRGPVVGNVDLKISGRNFDDTTEVRIGEQPCVIEKRDFGSVDLRLPAAENHKVGATKLLLETQNGSVSSRFFYTKASLTLTRTTTTMSAGGGLHKLTGDGFSDKTKILDGTAERQTGFVDPETLFVDWPPGTANATKDFTVLREDGETTILQVKYT